MIKKILSKNILIASMCIFVCFSQQLFFAIMGLFGLSYEGIDTSNIYLIYVVSIFLLISLFYIITILNFGIFKVEVVLFSILIIIFINHFIWNIYDSVENPILSNYLILFFLIGLPGFLSVITLIKYNAIENFIKLSDYLAIILVAGIFISVIIPFYNGIISVDIGGASSQFMSYIAALTFGVILFNTYQLTEMERFKLFNSRIYFIISHFLMIFCILSLLLGGGRGAFLVMIFYMLLHLRFLAFVKSKTKRDKYKRIFGILILIVFGIAFYLVFWSNEFVQIGFSRVTAYLGGDTFINLEDGSSDRDKIYPVALLGIFDSPFFGYGPFNISTKVIDPHNFFLEIILQYGFLAMLIFLLLIFYLLRSVWFSMDINHKWILNLSVLPAITLMFSGTYMQSTVFWFVLGFLISYKKS